MSDGLYIGLKRQENTVIKPTVGRIVWYRPSYDVRLMTFDNNMTVYDNKMPLAAQIVWVWSDTCVNLDVIDHAGVHHQRTSVTLLQALSRDARVGESVEFGEPEPISDNLSRGYCEWMPYQKGQAAKTEALEAAAKVG